MKSGKSFSQPMIERETRPDIDFNFTSFIKNQGVKIIQPINFFHRTYLISKKMAHTQIDFWNQKVFETSRPTEFLSHA